METASRASFWPKLLPMFLMLFLICFNYTLLRNLKDALIVPLCGAQVLPFIKVWVMLPAAVLSTIFFTYLSNHFSRSKVFYIIISVFLSYYLLFTFCIYPLRDVLQADRLADSLQKILPLGCQGLTDMLRNWAFTSFYVMAELWSSLVLLVLFWGFANEITRVSEATRFYSILNISSNTASIIAGQVAAFIASSSGLGWAENLHQQILLIALSCIGVLAIFFWMNEYVLKNPLYMPDGDRVSEKKKAKKLNFRESLAYIASSRYLLCIAAIVLSYNLVINMIEVIWKDELRQLYPDPSDYNAYMSNLTSIMGIISISASFAMVGIIRKFGWTISALITPTVLFITTFAFFCCLIGHDTLATVASAIFHMTPLSLAVFLGSLQNCFTKAAKYSLFDTTKDISFIPLAPDYKLKGKAAIDGIGSRLGKSGGSLIHQGLLLLCGTLASTTPYVAVILLCVIAIWIYSVRALGKRFENMTHDTPAAVGAESSIAPAVNQPAHAPA